MGQRNKKQQIKEELKQIYENVISDSLISRSFEDQGISHTGNKPISNLTKKLGKSLDQPIVVIPSNHQIQSDNSDQQKQFCSFNQMNPPVVKELRSSQKFATLVAQLIGGPEIFQSETKISALLFYKDVIKNEKRFEIFQKHMNLPLNFTTEDLARYYTFYLKSSSLKLCIEKDILELQNDSTIDSFINSSFMNRSIVSNINTPMLSNSNGVKETYSSIQDTSIINCLTTTNNKSEIEFGHIDFNSSKKVVEPKEYIEFRNKERLELIKKAEVEAKIKWNELTQKDKKKFNKCIYDFVENMKRLAEDSHISECEKDPEYVKAVHLYSERDSSSN